MQAPPHPVKVPPMAVAVSVTGTPLAKAPPHVPVATPAVTVQVIPSALDTVPLPVPAPLTVIGYDFDTVAVLVGLSAESSTVV